MQTQQAERNASPPGYMPLSRAAAAIGLRYGACRDLALTGRLTIRWVGSRVYVSIASVEAFKASRILERGGVRMPS